MNIKSFLKPQILRIHHWFPNVKNLNLNQGWTLLNPIVMGILFSFKLLLFSPLFVSKDRFEHYKKANLVN